jgi:hypothetical protein
LEDFLLIQGFDEQEGNIETLLEISQRIETMEEWSETKRSNTGKRPCSELDKNEKTVSNKKQKLDYFCEYHGQNKSHSTQDCMTCKSILQSARKSREEKHGTDKAVSNISTGVDYKKRVGFKKPWTKENKDEMMQTIFNTAFHKAAVKYMKEKVHKNDTVPTQEFNNLSLEEEDHDDSDSDSTSDEE